MCCRLYQQSIITNQLNTCVHKVRLRFLRKSKIGFLNLHKPDNGFCISLLSRLIQALSDHGASKELKNALLSKDSSVPSMHHDPSYLILISLVKKRKLCFRIYRDLRIQSWIFFKVPITPKYFFRLNKSLPLFETNCTFLN